MKSARGIFITPHKFLHFTRIYLPCMHINLLFISWWLEQHDIMGVKADISHFFALMKYILDNIDDRQISVMTSFRKKISYTFVFTRLCHEIIQYDLIPLRYVQVIHFFVYSGMPSLNSIPGIVLNISKQDGCHWPSHQIIRWRGGLIIFSAFYTIVLTHTVLPLSVHPAMMQVNGWCMTVNPFTVKVFCPRLRFPYAW